MDVERWPDLLSLLVDQFCGRGAQISVAAPPNSFAFLKSWGWTQAELAGVLPRYIALTPSDPRSVFLTTRYKATHCRQFISDEILQGSDIYKEVLAPMGIEYSMAFTVPAQQGMLCVLSVMRGPQNGVFTVGDCEHFGRLLPHIGRAVSMHGVFARCREEL